MKRHNHSACMQNTLVGTEGLTPLRRRVLEIVAASHRPLGAYDILAWLASDAPPTVYRALAYLQKNGLVHRIDSLQAYIACFARNAGPHKSHFLLCRACGQASEITSPALARAIKGAAGRRAFTVESETVEISGLCAACRKGDASAPNDRIKAEHMRPS